MGDRQRVRQSADRRRELIDGQDEPAEEHRRQEHEEGELDRLPLRIGDDGDQQAQPERSEQ